MGQIKNSIVLEKGLRTTFMVSLDNGENPTDVMPMITEGKSNGKSEKYGWLGDVPQLSEWLDSRKLHGLPEFDYEIKNKHYEGTLKVDRDDIEDDQYSHINMRINDLAVRAKTHPRKVFFDLLKVAETELCFDGQAFYSVNHKWVADSVAQSNLHTGTKAGAIPTVSEFLLDFEAIQAKMQSFVDYAGEPLNEGELKLKIVASPAMRSVLQKAFNADQIDSTTNTIKGAAEFMTTGRLSGADWYIFDNNGSIKAFIKQVRQEPRFAALEATSEAGFMYKEYKYGVDYRMGMGFGLWSKSMKCKY